MFELIVIVLVFVVPALMFALRRTRLWWLPGTGLLASAFAILASIEPVEDDIGGIGAMGNGIAFIFAAFIGLYGLVAVLVSWSYERYRRQLEAERARLPAATAVAGVKAR